MQRSFGVHEVSSAARRRLSIGLLINPEYGFARQVTLGAGRALAGTRFIPETLNMDYPPSAKRLRRFDGLIGMVASEAMHEKIRALRVPCINVSRAVETPGLPIVTIDNVAVGRMAAEHLLARGHRCFVYVGMPRRLFSDERRAGFVQVLREAGRDSIVIERPRRVADGRRVFSRWSRPSGVFCCNDTTARATIDAMVLGGLHVPNDFAVVGVDNDELLCLIGTVPMSSVDIRGEVVGETAARSLMSWMEGGSIPPAITLVPPSRVIVRASSDTNATDDPVVLRTIVAMQDHGCRDIMLKHIEELVGQSRRTIERAFRDRLGRSPAKELERLRVERATSLLLDTRLTSAEIADRVGFVSEQRMRRVFLRRFGMSPLQFRGKFGRQSATSPSCQHDEREHAQQCRFGHDQRELRQAGDGGGVDGAIDHRERSGDVTPHARGELVHAERRRVGHQRVVVAKAKGRRRERGIGDDVPDADGDTGQTDGDVRAVRREQCDRHRAGGSDADERQPHAVDEVDRGVGGGLAPVVVAIARGDRDGREREFAAVDGIPAVGVAGNVLVVAAD